MCGVFNGVLCFTGSPLTVFFPVFSLCLSLCLSLFFTHCSSLTLSLSTLNFSFSTLYILYSPLLFLFHSLCVPLVPFLCHPFSLPRLYDWVLRLWLSLSLSLLPFRPPFVILEPPNSKRREAMELSEKEGRLGEKTAVASAFLPLVSGHHTIAYTALHFSSAYVQVDCRFLKRQKIDTLCFRRVSSHLIISPLAVTLPFLPHPPPCTRPAGAVTAR